MHLEGATPKGAASSPLAWYFFHLLATQSAGGEAEHLSRVQGAQLFSPCAEATEEERMGLSRGVKISNGVFRCTALMSSSSAVKLLGKGSFGKSSGKGRQSDRRQIARTGRTFGFRILLHFSEMPPKDTPFHGLAVVPGQLICQSSPGCLNRKRSTRRSPCSEAGGTAKAQPLAGLEESR